MRAPKIFGPRYDVHVLAASARHTRMGYQLTIGVEVLDVRPGGFSEVRSDLSLTAALIDRLIARRWQIPIAEISTVTFEELKVQSAFSSLLGSAPQPTRRNIANSHLLLEDRIKL